MLTNTLEQAVLAVLLWPAAAHILPSGPGIVLVLGANFFFARLVFWMGYSLAPPLRAFGFAATFYPTLVVALAAIWHFAV